MRGPLKTLLVEGANLACIDLDCENALFLNPRFTPSGLIEELKDEVEKITK